MNYLLELGINEKTIKNIIDHYGEAISLSIECNEENITNIIKYFYQIGIKNIDQLLIYEMDIFLTDFEKIKNKFDKVDLETINNINDDFTYIEEI